MEEFDLIFSMLNNKNSETEDLPIFQSRKKLKPLTLLQKEEAQQKNYDKKLSENINNNLNHIHKYDSLIKIEENKINSNKNIEIFCPPLEKKLENIFNNKFRNSKSENNKKLNDKESLGMPPILNSCMRNYDLRYLDFRPLVITDEKKNVDLGYYYKIGGNDCPLVRSLLEDNGFIDVSNFVSSIFNREWTILWSSSSIETSMISKLNKYQKINHFPRSRELTRKDLLYINISKLKAICNKGFDFLPQSFIFPKESKFLEEEMARDSKIIWIVKPVSSSQGRGISITTDFKQIPSGRDLIVSKYISNPFLINGYKFDMRIYVFMTSIIPLRFYIYEDGFARFATEKYYIGQPFTSDRYMHLTNYAVNKQNKKFIPNIDATKDDEGSKWSLVALKNYFLSIGKDWNAIQKRIDDLIIKTIISAEHNMANSYLKNVRYKNCFELFGFDVLLDSNLQPWLMEVNFSPSLHIESPLDVKIKGELIAECLDLARILPKQLREKDFKISNDLSFEHKIVKEYGDNPLMKEFKFTKEVRENLWDLDEELKRVKKFRILYPNEESLNYRKLFIDEKVINFVTCLKILEDSNKKLKNQKNQKNIKYNIY